jgi:hypothetical protein
VTDGDWDHEAWEVKQLPCKEWIDEFSVDTPVFVQRFDGHMALANSAALRQAGITALTPDPNGGTIERDAATGEPTGILKDMAMHIVASVVPRPSADELEQAALKGLEEARRNGITSAHDISQWEHYPVYEKLEKDGRLTCRLFCRLPIDGYRQFVEAGVRPPHGSERLSRGSLKAFTDGSLGSDTAWFFDPYANNPANTGLAMEIVTSGKLREWALDADLHGLQLSIHAIGDRANATILDLFEEIERVNPRWDRRFRIEHAQHVRPDDLKRFARLDVVVSAQPYHTVDDGVWAEQRIGAERCRQTYAFKSFLNNGVRVCFGSDWTVAPLKALLGIQAAVTRQTLDGKNPGGWFPAEKLTIEEAIRCYTINNAYAEFREFDKGSIEKGKLADFVVLDRNILAIPAGEIGTTNVVMTVLDGEVVYRAENSHVAAQTVS